MSESDDNFMDEEPVGLSLTFTETRLEIHNCTIKSIYGQ